MGRYFGTDGFRGLYGRDLLDSHAYKIGRFLGCYQGKSNRVLIARDTRFSGPNLVKGLVDGILSSGGQVADLGVTSTPSVSLLVTKHSFDFGIMVSASHNPAEDNGIKIFGPLGEKLDASIESEIEDYLDGEKDSFPNTVGTVLSCEGYIDEYLDYLATFATKNARGVHVVFDCANGSSSALAPRLFSKLGLSAEFINNTPDGLNINKGCGSTHLESLQAKMARGEFELGFAFDGDADRLIAIRKDGRILDGDAQIFLAALIAKKKGELGQEKIVMTHMSNMGLEIALAKQGIESERVDVGDKYVHACLKEKGYSIGGEQSGHVLFLKEMNTGDGLLSAIHVLNAYCDEPEIYKSLDLFVVYPQVMENIRFSSRAEAKEAMKSPTLLAAIQKENENLKREGRVFVRASGTEPLLRLMVEAPTKEKCAEVLQRIKKYL